MKKRLITSLLSALIFSLMSCDETGYDHYYTEYLVTSNGQMVIEYLDEDENWQREVGVTTFYYEFNRDPWQPLELKIEGAMPNQRISAVIRAERKRLAEKNLTDDFPYIHLKVTDYPNY